MDIHDATLNRFKPRTSATITRTNGIAGYERSQNVHTTKENQPLKSLDLKQGQQIKGEIIDLRSDSVTLLIESGKQMLTAKLANDLPIAIGQSAHFLVTEDSQEHITLRYLPPDLASIELQTADKALVAANLPTSDRNRMIVTELIKHNMPVDKQSLMNTLRVIVSNPGTDPLTLILMQKNKIPVTPENIQQFQEHQNGTSSFSTEVNALVDHLMTFLNHDQLTEDQQVSLHQQLLSMATSSSFEVTDMEYNQIPLQNYYSKEEIQQITRVLSEKILESSNKLPQELKPALEQLAKGTLSISSTLDLVDHLYQANKELPSEEMLNTDGLSYSLVNTARQLVDTTPSLLTDVWNKFSIKQPQEELLNQRLTPIELTELEQGLDSLLGTEAKVQIKDGSIPIQQFLQTLQQELPNQSAQLLLPLLQSPEYLHVLKDGLQQKWNITPGQLEADNGINAFYQDLQEDLSMLKKMLNSTQMQKDMNSLKEPVKDLQENLNFVKSLNDMLTFLPLPLLFKEKKGHGELYVLTQKKLVAKENKNLSVMLHLTLENLGEINIFLQMDHNTVSSKFYIEDKDAYALVKENLPILKIQLKERGFIFHGEVNATYESFDFTKDFVDASGDDINLSRYNFDMRA